MESYLIYLVYNSIEYVANPISMNIRVYEKFLI